MKFSDIGRDGGPFIPQPSWPLFKLWVFCGGILLGNFILYPLVMWLWS